MRGNMIQGMTVDLDRLLIATRYTLNPSLSYTQATLTLLRQDSGTMEDDYAFIFRDENDMPIKFFFQKDILGHIQASMYETVTVRRPPFM